MEERSVILASASPRRTELLRQAGIPHVVIPSTVDEEALLAGLASDAAAVGLARAKAEATAGMARTGGYRFVLGADTLVLAGRRTLGKPKDEEEAADFLRALSGKSHRVVTGLCLFDRKDGSFSEQRAQTTVRFARLDEADIRWYLDTGEWQGVAGGYRIQERGGCLIEAINGTCDTVVGLPLRLVYGMLKAKHYPL